MQNGLSQVERYLIENGNYEISEMNVSRAFEVLKCNTLAKKWNYKSQYMSLLHLAHSAKGQSAEMEVFSANHFLDTYCKKLKTFGYKTVKILLLWALFIFLKNLLQKKKKSINEKSPPGTSKVTRGDRKIINFIINSLPFFVNGFFLLWWITSLQELLGKDF